MKPTTFAETTAAMPPPRDDTRLGRAQRYRTHAATCRVHAAMAESESAREDYLRMAREWDKLAAEVTAWAQRIEGRA
ncbi:MAG: hypothetical protein AB7E79_16450 [Rhodospirillaceae bacterium]